MRIRSNPKRNIRLSQLKDRQKGFISLFDVKTIKGHKNFNIAINLKAIVYTVKFENVFIPVFGTGNLVTDFDIDLSLFIVDKPVVYKDLENDHEGRWYPIKVDISDNVLFSDDSDFEDEFFEDYFDDWLISFGVEKKNLIKEVKDFLLRYCDSMDVREILIERKKTKISIKRLEKLISIVDDVEEDINSEGEFYGYDILEKKKLLDLFELKLDFINTYLLSSDNWQDLSKDVFLEIEQYMISKEKYKILAKPSRYFANKKI